MLRSERDEVAIEKISKINVQLGRKLNSEYNLAT
jgi:hypothetical protein